MSGSPARLDAWMQEQQAARRDLAQRLNFLYGDAYARMTSPLWAMDLKAWLRLIGRQRPR